MKRPVWQRTWYVLTAMFAISILVFALQWNTMTLGNATLAPRPAPRPFTPDQYIQQVQQCLDHTRASLCPTLPAALHTECVPPARRACLLS
ncbi:MAG: hypothetical protein ACHQ4F_11875 [Candidatus Dormibacteria bacterium]